MILDQVGIAVGHVTPIPGANPPVGDTDPAFGGSQRDATDDPSDEAQCHGGDDNPSQRQWEIVEERSDHTVRVRRHRGRTGVGPDGGAVPAF
jgi:hypothetical protein